MKQFRLFIKNRAQYILSSKMLTYQRESTYQCCNACIIVQINEFLCWNFCHTHPCYNVFCHFMPEKPKKNGFRSH